MDPLIDLAEAWWPLYAVHMLEVSLFIALVWAVDRWARLDTSLRYTLWLMALTKAFVPPVFSVSLPRFLALDPAPLSVLVGGSIFLGGELDPSVDAPIPLVESIPFTVWLFGFWAFSALVFASVSVWHNAAFRRKLGAAAPVDLHAHLPGALEGTTLQVYARPNLKSPLLIGFRKPRLYLPADWHTWTSAQLLGVLAHELDHHRNRDIWALAFQVLATVLFGLNPLIWVMNRRLGHLRELRCDEAAILRTGVNPVEYGKLLFAFLDERGPSTLNAMCFNEQGTSLKQRFEHVLNFKGGTMKRRNWQVMTVLLIGLAMVPLSIRETYSDVSKTTQIWMNTQGALLVDQRETTTVQDFENWLSRNPQVKIVMFKLDPESKESDWEALAKIVEKTKLIVGIKDPVPAWFRKRRQFEKFSSGANQIGEMEFSEVEVKPVPLHTIAPKYPEEARNQKIKGTVLVRFKVNVDGTVSDIRMLKAHSEGPQDTPGERATLKESESDFQGAAIEAIRQFTFKPAEHNGQPVAVWMTQPIRFRLSKKQDVLEEQERVEVPRVFRLLENHPNPFNPTTTINYDLPEASGVKLAIITATGQVIRTLVSKHQAAGRYQVKWNGKDEAGRRVASGIYYYRITTDHFTDVKWS